MLFTYQNKSEESTGDVHPSSTWGIHIPWKMAHLAIDLRLVSYINNGPPQKSQTLGLNHKPLVSPCQKWPISWMTKKGGPFTFLSKSSVVAQGSVSKKIHRTVVLFTIPLRNPEKIAPTSPTSPVLGKNRLPSFAPGRCTCARRIANAKPTSGVWRGNLGEIHRWWKPQFFRAISMELT